MDARQRSTTNPKRHIYGKNKPTSSLLRQTHKIEKKKKKKVVDRMRPTATQDDDKMFQIMSKWNISTMKKKNKEEEIIPKEEVDQDYKARILARWSKRMTMNV